MSTDPSAARLAFARAAADAVRACGPALSAQLAAWPSSAGPCAGVVLGPGRALLDDEWGGKVRAEMQESPGGYRFGVWPFIRAQALIAVELIAVDEINEIYDGGGAALARALREPTGPGEFMVVVLLEAGDAVVPVTPLTARGGGSA